MTLAASKRSSGRWNDGDGSSCVEAGFCAIKLDFNCNSSTCQTRDGIELKTICDWICDRRFSPIIDWFDCWLCRVELWFRVHFSLIEFARAQFRSNCVTDDCDSTFSINTVCYVWINLICVSCCVIAFAPAGWHLWQLRIELTHRCRCDAMRCVSASVRVWNLHFVRMHRFACSIGLWSAESEWLCTFSFLRFSI